MLHGLATTFGRRRTHIITTALLLSPFLAAWALAQEPTTSQPVKFSHAALLELARKAPLKQMDLTTAAGAPLSKSEQAELEDAAKAMETARAAREKGDFAGGTEPARRAFDIRSRILGKEHFLTVTSELFSRLLAGVSAAPPARQDKFVQADKDYAEAEKLYDEGKYAEGLAIGKKALEARESLLSDDHQEVAEALRVVGKCQIELRFLDDAETNLNRALTIAEARYGKAHPRVALVLDRLGWLQINQRRYQNATENFRRAVFTLGRTVGETTELAEALDNLGTAEFYVRQVEGAIRDKLRALVIRETLLGPDHAETGVSYSNLAWLYTQIGQRDEVIPLRQKALETLRNALGEDHPWVFLEISNLARVYEATGNVAEATKLSEQMVAHDKQSGKPLNARAIARLRDLAMLYLRTDRRDDGLGTLREARGYAIDMLKRGDTEPAIIQIMGIVQVFERGLRMYDAAAETLEMLHTAERAAGTKPDDEMLRRWTRLANLKIQIGATSEAEALLKEIVSVTEKEHGKDALRLAEPLLLLARVQQDMKQYEPAADTVERLLQISEKWFPKNSPAKVFALTESARVDAFLGRFDMAKFSLDEAKRIAEDPKNREQEPQAFIEVQRAFGDYHDARGQREEAVAARKIALDSLRQVSLAAKTLFLRGRLAELIKELLDSDDGKVLDATERNDLTKELKEILTELESVSALTAENKAWLKQLG